MSTKLSLLSPKLTTTFKPASLADRVMLNSMPGNPYSFSLRRLSLHADIPVLYKWMNPEYTAPLADEALLPLKQAYASILDSDFSWPFIGLANNIVTCQLELCRATQDAVSLCYEVRPGDYSLNILTDPRANEEEIVGLLSACIEYFFSFPEIGRLVASPEAGDREMKKLYRSLGFVWRKKVAALPYKAGDLYFCTRKSVEEQD